MMHGKPQPTPMISTLKLAENGSISVLDPSIYRFVVGALQYVTVTKPYQALC